MLSRNDLMKAAIHEHFQCVEYPRVGAIIAKNCEVLSRGYRGEQKGIHAERVAIEKLTPEQLKDSILYTTLEPCVALNQEQKIESCSQLIVRSGIREVVIGVLDPNGTVYSEGYKTLLENGISVTFFNRSLRTAIEEETFEFGEFDKLVGHGKRRIPVVGSGMTMLVEFSEEDSRSIEIRWSSLQKSVPCVDLISANGSVRIAAGAKNFSDITDPMVFRFPSHFARMKEGMIAVVKPQNATFCLIVKLLTVYDNDILINWQVRNYAH